MEHGTEDVPVVYLHDIKREYTQGATTLTILSGGTAIDKIIRHATQQALQPLDGLSRSGVDLETQFCLETGCTQHPHRILAKTRLRIANQL